MALNYTTHACRCDCNCEQLRSKRLYSKNLPGFTAFAYTTCACNGNGCPCQSEICGSSRRFTGVRIGTRFPFREIAVENFL